MKAIIFHGTDCEPDDPTYWYAWLASQLTARGYEVETPYYSELNHEAVASFLPKVLTAHSFDSDTILIGHSAGCPLILSILENVQQPIAQAILVAGMSVRLPRGSGDPIIQDSYDWEKIKTNANDFVFINAVNDPWGCDDEQGRIMFDHLGGAQIIMNDGHFGSTSQNQTYETFPLLEKLVK